MPKRKLSTPVEKSQRPKRAKDEDSDYVEDTSSSDDEGDMAELIRQTEQYIKENADVLPRTPKRQKQTGRRRLSTPVVSELTDSDDDPEEEDPDEDYDEEIFGYHAATLTGKLRKFCTMLTEGAFTVEGGPSKKKATPIPVDKLTHLTLKGNKHYPLKFPLSETDLAAVSRMGHRSKVGKGTETVLDDKIRKSIEFQPSEVELPSEFTKYLETKVASEIQRELAPTQAEIALKLHKFLIYQEGDFFHKHKDSQKSPHMFATLVVQLPSVFTGGKVVVQLAGKKKQFQVNSSDEGLGWLCWYADTNHQINKITSGSRAVLVYNVETVPCADENTVCQPHKAIGADEETITEFLHNCKKLLHEHPETEVLGFFMRHQYTLQTMNVNRLKGCDAILAKILQRKWNVDVVPITYEEHHIESEGYSPWSYWSHYSDDGEADTYSGLQIIKHLDPDDILPGSAPFEADKAWEDVSVTWINRHGQIGKEIGQDSHYLGNEGTNTHTTYMHTALVVYVRKRPPQKLKSPLKSPRKTASSSSSSSSSTPAKKTTMEELLEAPGCPVRVIADKLAVSSFKADVPKKGGWTKTFFELRFDECPDPAKPSHILQSLTRRTIQLCGAITLFNLHRILMFALFGEEAANVLHWFVWKPPQKKDGFLVRTGSRGLQDRPPSLDEDHVYIAQVWKRSNSTELYYYIEGKWARLTFSRVAEFGKHYMHRDRLVYPCCVHAAAKWTHAVPSKFEHRNRRPETVDEINDHLRERFWEMTSKEHGVCTGRDSFDDFTSKEKRRMANPEKPPFAEPPKDGGLWDDDGSEEEEQDFPW